MVLLFGKYFLGFLKYFLPGSSEIPNSADPCPQVCQVHPLDMHPVDLFLIPYF